MTSMSWRIISGFELRLLAIIGIAISLLVLPDSADAHVGALIDEPHQTAQPSGIPAPERDHKEPTTGHVNCHGFGAGCHTFAATTAALGNTIAADKDRLTARAERVQRDPPPFLPFRPPIAG